MTALAGTLLPATQGGKGKGGIAHNISDEKWAKFIGRISTGELIKPTLKSLQIHRSSLEAKLLDKKARSQYDNAKIMAMRQIWAEDVLEDVLVNIAMGGTVAQACKEAFMEEHVDSFYRLIMRDPAVKEAYDEARTIQAEKMAIDDIIEISDDVANDETWDGKGNSAAVNRSRLKVDSRKWIAGKLNFRRFGDKQQVDLEANIVVDHAARLEAARKRKENAFHDKKSSKGKSV